MVLLVAEFQGFCRDLHNEACTAFARAVCGGDDDLFNVVLKALTDGRGLDSGNPNLGTLQQDFGRLGLDLRSELHGSHRFNIGRRRKLGQALDLRNAIAHSDPRRLPDAAGDTYDVKLSDEARYALVDQHLHGPSDPAKPHLVTVRLSTVVPLRLMTEDQILEHLRNHCPRYPGDEWDWDPERELYAELKRRNLAEPAIDELVFGRRSKRRRQP